MFVSNVNLLMEKKDIGHERLQKETGLSPETIARARDARIGTCSLNTLGAISTVLGVWVKDLFNEVSGAD